MIFTPYFLSKPSTEAITTLAQSVRGMKPILTSSFSGASEPAAQTPLWPSVEKKVAVAAPFLMKSRREACAGVPASAGLAAAIGVVVSAVMSNSLLIKKSGGQKQNGAHFQPSLVRA
jgi:hypothetical protein